jgi:hypothetical protein
VEFKSETVGEEAKMAGITIGDLTGNAQVEVDNSSLAGKSQLSSLISSTTTFVKELPKTIDQAQFQSATLTATFKSPSISLDTQRTLTVQAGVNSELTRYTTKDTPLLGSDPTVPEIDIGANDYWVSFELDGTLQVSAAQKSASGFGVSITGASTLKLSIYQLFNATPKYPTLEDAIGQTLNLFALVSSATDLRNQKVGTVLVADQSGTFTVSGTYSFPMSLNQLALAGAVVPFKINLNPSLSVSVGGSVAVTGELAVRSWRTSNTQLILGLFKQKSSTLTSTFSASAGLAANAGNTDLVQAFFQAIDPGVNLQNVLPQTDPRYTTINNVLQTSITQGLNISINASDAATFGDESALVYAVDLSANQAATDNALNAAIEGDWTLIAQLPNAKELKNVVGTNHENKFTFSINLLGIFDYQSVEDFVRKCTVLHNGDGSITITDQATATSIAVASMPYLADPKKLRKVFYQCLTPTLAYSVAGATKTVSVDVGQSLFLFYATTNTAQLEKDLLLAVAIGELTQSQLQSIQISNPKPSHVVISASQDIKGIQALNMFFADPTTFTARDLDSLKAMGKQVLASLLDPNDPVDQRRVAILNNPAIWNQMDNNQFPPDSPASYSDWYVVTFWANAIHDTASPLANALQALAQVPVGTDPSTDNNFTNARKKLVKAMSEVARDTQAPFEDGWPIAIMYKLAGGGTGASMTASWDSQTHIPLSQQLVMQPNALAKRIAGRKS